MTRTIQPPPLFTKERFTQALVQGMPIPHTSDVDLLHFGHRMIDWINETENEYWACWNPKSSNDIILDIRNIEIMHVQVQQGRVVFLRPGNGVAEDLPKEFGNAAVGVMLFCMMESGEIEEVDPEEIAKATQSQHAPQAEPKPPPDFDWI